MGGVDAVNQQALAVVNEMASAPTLVVWLRRTGRFGDVIELRSADGRGVRVSETTQEFIGSLEP